MFYPWLQHRQRGQTCQHTTRQGSSVELVKRGSNGAKGEEGQLPARPSAQSSSAGRPEPPCSRWTQRPCVGSVCLALAWVRERCDIADTSTSAPKLRPYERTRFASLQPQEYLPVYANCSSPRWICFLQSSLVTGGLRQFLV